MTEYTGKWNVNYILLAILKFILILRMGFNSKPKWTLTWKTSFDFALKIGSESENSFLCQIENMFSKLLWILKLSVNFNLRFDFNLGVKIELDLYF